MSWQCLDVRGCARFINMESNLASGLEDLGGKDVYAHKNYSKYIPNIKWNRH